MQLWRIPVNPGTEGVGCFYKQLISQVKGQHITGKSYYIPRLNTGSTYYIMLLDENYLHSQRIFFRYVSPACYKKEIIKEGFTYVKYCKYY